MHALFQWSIFVRAGSAQTTSLAALAVLTPCRFTCHCSDWLINASECSPPHVNYGCCKPGSTLCVSLFRTPVSLVSGLFKWPKGWWVRATVPVAHCATVWSMHGHFQWLSASGLIWKAPNNPRSGKKREKEFEMDLCSGRAASKGRPAANSNIAIWLSHWMTLQSVRLPITDAPYWFIFSDICMEKLVTHSMTQTTTFLNRFTSLGRWLLWCVCVKMNICSFLFSFSVTLTFVPLDHQTLVIESLDQNTPWSHHVSSNNNSSANTESHRLIRRKRKCWHWPANRWSPQHHSLRPSDFY